MAYTTINKSSDYFNTKLYTGNGSTNAQTGVGFTPSFTWIKNRGDTHAHVLVDAVRGVTKELRSSGTNAEITTSNSFTSFDSDGFTLGADSTDSYNKNSNNYTSWNWLANGQGSSNTDGSINTTYTSANTTSGFSIVKYTGTGANATVGHGLGVAPKMIIFKNTNTVTDWDVYHGSLANTERIHLNTTGAKNTAAHAFNSTSPTTSVFSVGTADNTNKSSSPMIAYCFADVQGYSKFGSYTGNGNADGVFQYLGFKPAWVMIKKTSGTGSWWMFDNKRLGYNPSNSRFYTNDTATEATATVIDFLSNGFKFRSDDGELNASGGTYVYIAFASSPLVSSNNVPANAR